MGSSAAEQLSPGGGSGGPDRTAEAAFCHTPSDARRPPGETHTRLPYRSTNRQAKHRRGSCRKRLASKVNPRPHVRQRLVLVPPSNACPMAFSAKRRGWPSRCRATATAATCSSPTLFPSSMAGADGIGSADQSPLTRYASASSGFSWLARVTAVTASSPAERNCMTRCENLTAPASGRRSQST